ncbi:hypothetical protein [Streptomyces sp. NPDC057403]|uniref:hypothetical protein n=1 Tax=Streptomyces sp. NPDC057403 TaxID=3346119 RepID=UPI003691BA99
MPLTLAHPLSETLHDLLAHHTLRERNKELALALVQSANRGEVCPLTDSGALDRPLLVCDGLLADGDRVALRLTATTEAAVWQVHAEFCFDAAGRVVEYYAAHLPAAAR